MRPVRDGRIDFHAPPHRRRVHHDGVAESCVAVRLRVAPAANAVGESILFKSEFVRRSEPLFEPATANLAEEAALFVIGKGRVKRGPAQFTMEVEK